MVLDIILIAAMVLAALWTVMTMRLLRSVVGLALTSAVLTIIMFRLDAPLAAVFELSVCAGLISAVFISSISLTRRLTAEAEPARRKARLGRYWLLPVLLAAAGVAMLLVKLPLPPAPEALTGVADVRNILWNVRRLDLLGQIVILLAGAFGVVILFKDWKRE